MRGQPVIASIVILIACAGLAGADYVLSERPHMIAMQEEQSPVTPPDTVDVSSSSISSSVSVSSSEPTVMMSSSEGISSSSKMVKKGVSTKKASGVNVDDVLARLQLISKQTNEASFLLLTAPEKSAVKVSVLLRNNDRAFLLSWVENDNVKTIFSALKQTLQEQFSGKVTDLIDETRRPENGPPVDYLSFIDPALSSERIVFFRVRNRLYELHAAENGAPLLETLVTELSK